MGIIFLRFSKLAKVNITKYGILEKWPIRIWLIRNVYPDISYKIKKSVLTIFFITNDTINICVTCVKLSYFNGTWECKFILM